MFVQWDIGQGTKIVRHAPDGTETTVVDGGQSDIYELTASPTSGRIAYTRRSPAPPPPQTASCEVCPTTSVDAYVANGDGSEPVLMTHTAPGGWINLSQWHGHAVWFGSVDHSYAHDEATGRSSLVSGCAFALPDPAERNAMFVLACTSHQTRIWHVVNGVANAIGPKGYALRAVSPNGQLLAVGDGPSTLALMTRNGTIVRVLDSGTIGLHGTAFSPDGTQLYYTKRSPLADSNIDREDIVRIAVNGSDAGHPHAIKTATEDTSYSYPALTDTDVTAPTSPARPHVLLRGTHPRITWTLPAGANHVDIVRTHYDVYGDAVDTETIEVAPAAQSYVDAVEVADHYGYDVVAVDGSGNRSGPSSTTDMIAAERLDLDSPARASDTSTNATFTVAWGAPSDAQPSCMDCPVSVTTEAQYRRAGGAWHGWRLDSRFTDENVFGAGGKPVSPALGAAYDVRLRARDSYGNTTEWTTRRTLVPLDDNALALSAGWKRVRNVDDYGHQIALTRRAGATAALTRSGRGFQIIGDACPACATFTVIVDGRVIGTWGSYGTSTTHRRLLASIALGRGTHHLVIRARSTSRRPELRIDAIAVLP